MKQDTSGEDVREVQASRDEAASERDFAESVIDTLREPLLVLDGDLTVMSANRSFYRKFGVTREQTEGRLLYELGNGQWDIPQLREALETVIPQDSSFEDIEVEHDFPHIGRKVICLNGRRLERAYGGAPAVLLAMEDITGRKDAERDRDRAFQELERSNAELEQFAYIASHDLQEPLRMVMSYCQLLERRYSDKLDEDAKEFISYAVNGAGRMQQLINDLLAYSRVGTRGGPLEPTDCNAVVSQARDNVQMSARETGADISWGQHADAPRPDLVLLDLNLPEVDGMEVLRQVKQDSELQSIPVVVLTASKAEQDIVKSYNLHANCYITKPVDLNRFMEVIGAVDGFWLSFVRYAAK